MTTRFFCERLAPNALGEADKYGIFDRTRTRPLTPLCISEKLEDAKLILSALSLKDAVLKAEEL